MRHSTQKYICLLTPSPPQHIQVTRASAAPRQGSPCHPSSSCLGRLSSSKHLLNLRNFAWKRLLPHTHSLNLPSSSPPPKLHTFPAILQRTFSPQMHKSVSDSKHSGSPTGPTATGNCSQVYVTLMQGCTPHQQFTSHKSASVHQS